LGLSCVILLATRSIPKTTSGKIARSWCKRGYLNNTLTVIYKWEGASGLDAQVDVGVESALESNAVTTANINLYQANQNEDTSPRLTAVEIRALSKGDIISRLETTLLKVAAHSPGGQISSPVDAHAPLMNLGLDSMTIVQFKGVLENRFFCDVPDDFLFTSICTLDSLSTAVLHGSLTQEQKEQLEVVHKAAEGNPHNNNLEEQESAVVVVDSYKEPCCPWFYWCS
jgi:hypothetical protein